MYRVSLRRVTLVAVCAIIAGCASPNSHDLIRPEITAVAPDKIAGTHQIFVATPRGQVLSASEALTPPATISTHKANLAHNRG